MYGTTWALFLQFIPLCGQRCCCRLHLCFCRHLSRAWASHSHSGQRVIVIVERMGFIGALKGFVRLTRPQKRTAGRELSDEHPGRTAATEPQDAGVKPSPEKAPPPGSAHVRSAPLCADFIVLQKPVRVRCACRFLSVCVFSVASRVCSVTCTGTSAFAFAQNT